MKRDTDLSQEFFLTWIIVNDINGGVIKGVYIDYFFCNAFE